MVEELEVCSLLLYIVEFTAVNKEMFWKFLVYFSLEIDVIELDYKYIYFDRLQTNFYHLKFVINYNVFFLMFGNAACWDLRINGAKVSRREAQSSLLKRSFCV